MLNRHFGCVHVLAIINCAAINICLFELEFSPFPDICPGVGSETARLYGNSIFSCLRNPPYHFSTSAVPIYIPPNSIGGFPFLITSPLFIIFTLFKDGHSDWYEIIPHCSFHLHFTND